MPEPAIDVPEPQSATLCVPGPDDGARPFPVILLLSAGPGGALGLIINKPTATKVSSRFGDIGSRSRGGDPLFFGGLMGGHELLMLRRDDRAPEDWGAVVDRVSVTNSCIAMMDALMTARTDEEAASTRDTRDGLRDSSSRRSGAGAGIFFLPMKL